MKKLVFGLAMLASLSTFAISPVKKSVLRPVCTVKVSCEGIEATCSAGTYAAAVRIAHGICPQAFVFDIVR